MEVSGQLHASAALPQRSLRYPLDKRLICYATRVEFVSWRISETHTVPYNARTHARTHSIHFCDCTVFTERRDYNIFLVYLCLNIFSY